jgi:hypothetical protein
MKVGTRVEIHPRLDLWMCGYRYGEVVKIGRKYIHVKMDGLDKPRKFIGTDLMEV